MTNVTPMQLMTSIVLIIALSFSVANGMCNADIDDDCSVMSSLDLQDYSSDEYEEENIQNLQVCKTCGEDYIVNDELPYGYCNQNCITTEPSDEDDEYMAEYKRDLKKSRKMRNKLIYSNNEYIDNFERVCGICNYIYYGPNGPHWHSVEDRECYAKNLDE